MLLESRRLRWALAAKRSYQRPQLRYWGIPKVIYGCRYLSPGGLGPSEFTSELSSS